MASKPYGLNNSKDHLGDIYFHKMIFHFYSKALTVFHFFNSFLFVLANGGTPLIMKAA
jgi:hypothetical protein